MNNEIEKRKFDNDVFNEVLKEQNLNGSTIAKYCDLSKESVKGIIKKRTTNPKVSTLKTIAKFMGTTVDELVRGAVIPNTEVVSIKNMYKNNIKKEEFDLSKIKTLMKERNITSTFIVMNSGVPYSSLHNMFYKKMNPLINTMLPIADAIGVPVDDII